VLDSGPWPTDRPRPTIGPPGWRQVDARWPETARPGHPAAP